MVHFAPRHAGAAPGVAGRVIPLPARRDDDMIGEGWQGNSVSTIYDWVTVALFAGLIVLFLQRSVGDESEHDAFWPYIVAAIGCALVNWLGNHGYAPFAILAGLALLGFVYLVLRPFGPRGN